MNSQTKTMAIATLITFALMLISAITGALNQGYIEPLDTLNPVNLEVISYWAGYLGGLPLVVALITVAVTARKAGFRSTLLNGIGGIVLIPLVLVPLIVTMAVAFSTNGDHPFAEDGVGRRLFVKQAKDSCTTKLLQTPNVSSAIIDSFCTCYANEFANSTTRTDALYVNAHVAREKAAAIGARCRQHLL